MSDDSDYRYFLPRIFDLAVTEFAWLGLDAPVIASKLQRAEWSTWPHHEQLAVQSFFEAAFQWVVELHPDDGLFAGDWLSGIATLQQPVRPSLEFWLSNETPNAALQLAAFVIAEAKNLWRREEVHGPFWEVVDGDARREVATYLTGQEAKACLESASGRVGQDDQFMLIDAALKELQRQF